MDVAELDYNLPPELIAHHPAQERGASRLLVVDATHESAGVGPIGRFDELFEQQLRDGDLIVANDTRVLHARLKLSRPGGGAAELLLLQPLDDTITGRWSAMARPARRLRAHMPLTATDGSIVTCIRRDDDGTWIVDLPQAARDNVARWLEEVGEVPLPPYIEARNQPADRYQTIYGADAGSVAAPTAGLHFDDALWQRLRSNFDVAHVTLHVGAGTFQPIRVDNLAQHIMHTERYTVSDTTYDMVKHALRDGRRVVAIGTTTTRVLESVFGPSARGVSGETNLFITPGYSFGCVGAMLTNFHLPRSTLIALVMARAGVERTRTAYAQAIAERMRFYSFGDAMFIHAPPVVRP